MDYIVRDGQLTYFALHENLNTCYEFYRKDSPIGGVRVLDAEKVSKAKSFALRVLSAVGLPDGLYHLEAFYDHNSYEEPYTFIEVARRPGGGFVPQLIESSDDIDWSLKDMEWQLGLPSAVDTKLDKPSRAVGTSAVISSLGCVDKLKSERAKDFLADQERSGWKVVSSRVVPKRMMWVRLSESDDQERVNKTQIMLDALEEFCSASSSM